MMCCGPIYVTYLTDVIERVPTAILTDTDASFMGHAAKSASKSRVEAPVNDGE